MVKNDDTVYFYYNEDGTNGKNNLYFFYDARNKPAVVTFNGTAYAYLYNLQGDVTRSRSLITYSLCCMKNIASKGWLLGNLWGHPFNAMLFMQREIRLRREGS